MPHFSIAEHVVLASHLTGAYDVNRNQVLADDDFSLVQAWADSLAAQGVQGILFHNNFSAETCAAHQNEFLSFVRVGHDPRYSPNVYRYLLYRDFLRAHAKKIKALFITDVTDVVVLQHPFKQPLFREHPHALFCGDEPKTLENEWMQAHSAHLRIQIEGFLVYEKQFANSPLLNCGIIGGHIAVMQELLEALADLHQAYNCNNPTAYTGDMGAFNFLARTLFNDRLFHGAPVNTVFKGYEDGRDDCWFRHK